MNTNTQQNSFKVFLSYSAHDIAKQRSQSISNPEKTKRVYLNSLAVYAVEYYLRCMSFETVEEKEASQNLWMPSLFNSADVEIKNVGKLECFPVSPHSKNCKISSNISTDRLGYVFVQLNLSLNEANIIGFTTYSAPIVALNQLQSVNELLEYLTQKEQAAIVNVRQWAKGIIAEGWQTLDSILNPQQAIFARSSRFNITLGKKIDLGLQIDDISVALVAKVASENQDTINMVFQVHPVEYIYLPKALQLIVNDENGEAVLDATSRDNDNWIEVELSAQVGEKFSVDICLGDSKITQEFIV
jgi:Protein of unknown function (DUF1822)